MGKDGLVVAGVLLNLLFAMLVGPSQAARSTLQQDEFFRTGEEQAPFNSWLAAVESRVNANGVKDAKPGRFFPIDAGVKLNSGDISLFVDIDGTAQFTKVQDALDAIPEDKSRTNRVVIFLKPGSYYEQIHIDKPYVTLQGSGKGKTSITWKEDLAQSGSDVTDAAAIITGEYFTAIDISFVNSSPAPKSGAVGKQATALAVTGDKAAFFRVGFYGYQDTLYDKEGRHYFQDCYIQGSIDFIYGDGQSYYTNSVLEVIPVQVGSLTAQKRFSKKESTGFSFVDCKVLGKGYIYLGRAWGPASRTVFSTTYLANIIIPAAWQDWNLPSRDRTVFYGEYKNYGPGASTKGRVSYARQLTTKEAAPYQTINFIDGYSWLPNSGLHY